MFHFPSEGHNHSDDKSQDSDDSAYSSLGAQPVTCWGRKVAGLSALALPASTNTLVQPVTSPQASLLQIQSMLNDQGDVKERILCFAVPVHTGFSWSYHFPLSQPCSMCRNCLSLF